MTPRAMDKKAQSDQIALFVSDLHLQASQPRTTQAFFDFLNSRVMQVKQLYLLGDLFEYWAGDDDLANPYISGVVNAIRQVADSGVKVFWIAGNRDFLAGKDFARAAGVTLLPDPFVITIAGQSITLTHGDAQCTDDVSYMAFREQVRQPKWQQQFLALPLEKRKTIIDEIRAESRSAQRGKSMEIMDVNADAVTALFESTETSIIIHGHTHRPARHVYRSKGTVQLRYVLPDWDCDSGTPRGGWIAAGSDGTFKRFDINGVELKTL